jgi:enoyl-CoA hydratase/carnithine racemase
LTYEVIPLINGARPPARKTKETVLRTMTSSYEEAWAIEKANAELTIRTEDAREGPLAFMERRKPVFRGR